jgi:hypothetical protein
MPSMPPSAAAEPEDDRSLPPQLAEQVASIAAQLAPGAVFQGDAMLGRIDAALLNVCDIAAVDFALLNRTLALRAAAEKYGQKVDEGGRGTFQEREEARRVAEAELGALEEVLYEARPSAMILAKGGGW